jgi:hypothetical protein
VSIPPAPSIPARATTTRGTGTTTAPTTVPGPTTTVLPSTGDFCSRVRAYEAIADRDFEVDANWSFRSGKTDAEFGQFIDAAFRELATVAPANAVADFRAVSDWWQPSMGVRDLFGAGVAIPPAARAAIERMNATIDACG